jgi:hypothetical protein
MITFKCRSCGHSLRVPEAGAGRKGKCPKCSTVIRVPRLEPEPPEPLAPVDLPDGDEGALHLKRESLPASSSEGLPAWAVDNVAETLLRDDHQEDQGKRKYPWPVDILLYPANAPGLVNLGLFWFLPIGVAFVCQFIFIPCLGFILSLVVPAYMIYYFADCIRDSAKGNTRAPDNVSNVPAVRDAFAQFLCVIATIVMAFLPTGIVFVFYRQMNGLAWVCFGLGVFMLPMALLATIMRDTGAGLNPFVWIMAILRTLIPYTGLAGIFLALNVGLVFYMQATDDYLIRHILVTGPFIYTAMILMHLFGRFYYRYEKRLDW